MNLYWEQHEDNHYLFATWKDAYRYTWKTLRGEIQAVDHFGIEWNVWRFGAPMVMFRGTLEEAKAWLLATVKLSC